MQYDAQRPLAPEGRAAATRLGEILVSIGQAPTGCTCSPLVRARETASLVLEAAGVTTDPELSTTLAPGCAVEDVMQVPAVTEGPQLVVIHEPDVSRVLSAILGRPWPCAVLPGDCFGIRLENGVGRAAFHFSLERGR